MGKATNPPGKMIFCRWIIDCPHLTPVSPVAIGTGRVDQPCHVKFRFWLISPGMIVLSQQQTGCEYHSQKTETDQKIFSYPDHKFSLLSLINRYVISKLFSGINLPGSTNLGLGIIHHFLPVGDPARQPTDGKHHSKHIHRDPHGLI